MIWGETGGIANIRFRGISGVAEDSLVEMANLVGTASQEGMASQVGMASLVGEESPKKVASPELN